jgi:uncharacterized RDD family membrane protein YckC
MTCSFCGSRITDGETRCRRCGRKPGDTLPNQFNYQTQGALAQDHLPQPGPVPVEPPPPIGRPMAARPVQRSLFPEDAPKVVAISPGPRTIRPAKPRTSKPRVVEMQEKLPFLPAAPAGPKKLGTTVEAVIFCDAPVATRLHRAAAATLDLAMILLGYGIFLLGFRAMGGDFSLNKASIVTMAAVFPVLGFAYGLLWALAATETPGQRWTQLRLITFEGFPPEPRQRMWRFAGACLSMCTGALGLVWALADEESLTWPDHMSRTFVTPDDEHTRMIRRQ